MKKKAIFIAAAISSLSLSAGCVFADNAEINLASLNDVTTLDVAKTSDYYLVPMNIFDRLFETRMVDGSSVLKDSLCTDYSVSDDGLVYDFTIRDGVVFSNGNALTSSDVRYSFERLLTVGQDNTDIPMEVLGSDEFAEGKADHLEGFVLTDDTHFSITLKAPNAGFPAELSAPAMSIVDEESMAEHKNFGSSAADTIGSGPYIITEWVPNDHFTLEYNELYWGDEPSVKKAVIHVIPDAGTQNLMFQNGELDLIDLAFLDSMVVESSYKTMYADSIVSTPMVGMTYLVFNENNEYLKDVNVRKAVAMAIDVDSLIDSIFNGNATREYGIIPKGIWGHNDEFKSSDYDPAGAKALLEKAGYKSGQVSFELALDSNANSNTRLVYQAISQMLQEVGINAEIKNYDHSAWLDLRLSGEMDCFVARWLMDYNDPANIMYTFFGTEANTKQRSLNYPDKAIIKRVSDARAIVDDDERMAEYRDLEEKIIGEDAAWASLYEEQHLFCMSDRLESFTPQWAGYSDQYLTDIVLR